MEYRLLSSITSPCIIMQVIESLKNTSLGPSIWEGSYFSIISIFLFHSAAKTLLIFEKVDMLA